MTSVVNLQQIISLDRVISRQQLHLGDPRDPVIPSVLLKDVSWYYGLTARHMLAVTQRWKAVGRRFIDVALNVALDEPEWTAERRHAVVHEWAHIFCKHRGDMFILWQKEGSIVDDFDWFINNAQERQCEYVSAYILVRDAALKAMHGETNAYIAQQIDVPVHLVELRWWIRGRFGR